MDNDDNDDNDYQEKYLKYKNKYLELKHQLSMKGGIIGQIPINRLKEEKTNIEIPRQIKDYISMITVPDTEVVRVGSSVAKIQPYFSDVDVMNIVNKSSMSTDELISFFIQQLKNIINNLTGKSDRFFSDFKAGGVHWKPSDILAGQLDNVSLKDVLKIKDVVKIDMIFPYDERYVEMSTFFVLKSKDGFVNVDSDYFSSFADSLRKDINEYKDIKPFKAIKRVWSLSRTNNDMETLNKLQNLIKSNIAIIAQINADIETIILLIEHNDDYDNNFVINEVDKFKERLSNILDIEYDEEKADIMIDKILLLFKYNTVSKNKNELLGGLENLHDYLLEIVNKETREYLDFIEYTFPDDSSNVFTKIYNYLF
jgi:hypothetical protein